MLLWSIVRIITLVERPACVLMCLHGIFILPTWVTGGRYLCFAHWVSIIDCFDMWGPFATSRESCCAFWNANWGNISIIPPSVFYRWHCAVRRVFLFWTCPLPSPLFSPLSISLFQSPGSSLAPLPKVPFKMYTWRGAHLLIYSVCLLMNSAQKPRHIPACSLAFKTACVECDSPWAAKSSRPVFWLMLGGSSQSFWCATSNHM